MELGNLGNGTSGRQLESMIGQRAAAQELFQAKERTWNKNVGDREPDFNRIKAIIGSCFILMYVVLMVFSTLLVQQQYRKRYLLDFDSVENMMLQNQNENVTEWVNHIGDIKSASEGQLFSAAIYDVSGERIAVTEPCIRLTNYGGQTLYFPMKEYFKMGEEDNLISSARAYERDQLVHAVIDQSTGRLLSLKVGTDAHLMDWKNTTDTLDKDNLQNLSSQVTVQELISVPYYEDEDDYKKWMEDTYLHDFAENIDIRKSYGKWTIPFLEDAKMEHITKIYMKNDQGHSIVYYLSIRATGNTLGEAVSLLTPAYFVGFALTVSSLIAVDMNINKLKKK